MKKLFPLLLLLLFSGLYAGAQKQKKVFDSEWGQPLLVLTETDPWLMVAGADVPSFALYESGRVLYRKTKKGNHRYYIKQLGREEKEKFLSEELLSPALLQLAEKTVVSKAADQPTNEIIYYTDTLIKKQVYGNLRKDEKARKETPESFLKVYDALINFDDEQALTWLPDKIEVLVTDFHHSPEQALKWPSSWPSLKSPDTIWRSEKLYSLYLDKEHFQELLKLMDSLGEKQAVEINGKKFAISYRLPFPNI